MKISKRYPVVNGDIDRAWLVDQLPRAKRPNALLTVALCPLPIIRIAAQAWVTPDTLIDFILGDDDLSPMELNFLGRALDILDDGFSGVDWLLGETLGTTADDEEISEVMEMLHNMPADDPVTLLTARLLKTNPAPSVAVTTPILYADIADMSFAFESRATPRSKRITRRRRKAA